MKFVVKEDVALPASALFDEISDFAGFERSAIERGLEVARSGDLAIPEPGLAWDVTFSLHGNQRKINLVLKALEVPQTVLMEGQGSGLRAEMEATVVRLSPDQSRLVLRLDLKPKTLPGRLMIQSMKLARGRISKRFQRKVSEFLERAANKQPA